MMNRIFLSIVLSLVLSTSAFSQIQNANAAANPYKFIGTAASITGQTCNPQNGDLAFATDAATGQHLYLCSGVNTWTKLTIDGTGVTTGTVAGARLAGGLTVTSLADSNANTALGVTAVTAGAINNFAVSAAATTAPALFGIGTTTDANVGMTFKPKGTGLFNVTHSTNTGAGLSVPGVASAVNGFLLTPAATGSAPVLSSAVSGADANSPITFSSNGTGLLNLATGNAARTQFQVKDTAGTVINWLQATGAATTAAPALAIGTTTDANVGMTFAPKGTGAFNVTQSTNTGPGLSVVGVASAVNGLLVTPAATGSTPVLSSAVSGADATSPITIQGNTTGAVNLSSSSNTNPTFTAAGAASAVNGMKVTAGATGTSVAVTSNTTGADSVADIVFSAKGSGGAVIIPGATYTVTQQGITDASLATGVVLVPAVASHTLRVVAAEIQPIAGTVATCTDIRIGNASFASEVLKFLVSGTLLASTWYDEASPVAQVTSVGNTVTPFGVQFAAGAGIGIYSTGSTCATATSFNAIVKYTYN